MGRQATVTKEEIITHLKSLVEEQKQYNPGALVSHFGGGKAARYKEVIDEFVEEQAQKRLEKEAHNAVKLPQSIQEGLEQMLTELSGRCTNFVSDAFIESNNIHDEKLEHWMNKLEEQNQRHKEAEQDFIAANDLAEETIAQLERALAVSNEMLATLQTENEQLKGKVDLLSTDLPNILAKLPDLLSESQRRLNESTLNQK